MLIHNAIDKHAGWRSQGILSSDTQKILYLGSLLCRAHLVCNCVCVNLVCQGTTPGFILLVAADMPQVHRYYVVRVVCLILSGVEYRIVNSLRLQSIRRELIFCAIL